MTHSITRHLSAFCVTAFMLSLFPLHALVAPVASAQTSSIQLRVSDEQVVNRGDMIRAIVKALKKEVNVHDASALPYKRVSKALRPYVRVAHDSQALEMYGTDLLLASGITRGEALQIAVAIGNFNSKGRQVTFKDVNTSTKAGIAVVIAVENAWMQPITEDLFGARRVLTGKDANLFLRKLQGDHQPLPSQNRTSVEVQQPERLQVSTAVPRVNSPLPKVQNIEAMWNHIMQHYINEEKISPDEAYYKMAEALMKSLDDRYSTFMKPVQTRSFNTQLQGEVSGIGAQVEYVDGFLTIVSPLRGSPAEAAGLKPGDQILQVDGFDLVDIGFIEAVEKVRGPKGSMAKLKIRRSGIEFDVEVERNTISIPEINISEQGDGFFVIKLHQFGRLTQNELRGDIAEINAKQPKGVVLDLRKNPGGLLEAAKTVVEDFLPEGSTVAHIKKRNSTRDVKTEKPPVLDQSVRMVVLIDEGSASASEIVAAALQDYGRATIVGKKSFGKGTVQQVLQFSDQSAFKLTIAEYLSPKKRKIDGVGVIPDKEIDASEQDDVQLKEALRMLR